MTTQYVKPTMIKLGKSEELIQGECGFGLEGWAFDKTGAVWTTRRKQVKIGSIYQCMMERACSADSNEC